MINIINCDTQLLEKNFKSFVYTLQQTIFTIQGILFWKVVLYSKITPWKLVGYDP